MTPDEQKLVEMLVAVLLVILLVLLRPFVAAAWGEWRRKRSIRAAARRWSRED